MSSFVGEESKENEREKQGQVDSEKEADETEKPARGIISLNLQLKEWKNYSHYQSRLSHLRNQSEAEI